MRSSSLILSPLAAAMAFSMSSGDTPEPRALPRAYRPAKGKTNALKIRRASIKARNVRKHKRNCRG